MKSNERLEIYDRFIEAREEINEIKEYIPYDKGDIQIAMNMLDKLEKRIYLWWRKG
tara:strand:+ start:63 stop:230 length:168 start_codon:yes stop_codon:yes gene_type:complete